MSRKEGKIVQIEDKFKITPKLLEMGHKLFIEIDPRDSMYKVSSFLVSKTKKKPFNNDIWITDALLVLLLTWHNAFYRYGMPSDFHSQMKKVFENYRDIFTNQNIAFSFIKVEDKPKFESLFNELLDILSITTKNGQKRRSGTAVAKALHLLNSNLFPLWDDNIARSYLGSNTDTKKFEHYFNFKNLVDKQYKWYKSKYENKKSGNGLSISEFYKKIDELNYMFFTRSNLSPDSLKIFKKYKQLIDEVKIEMQKVIDDGKENIYLKILTVKN